MGTSAFEIASRYRDWWKAPKEGYGYWRPFLTGLFVGASFTALLWASLGLP